MVLKMFNAIMLDKYIQFQFQFKRFFIVYPHIKKTYNGETFHGHCYNALRAKLTRRLNDFGIIILSTVHSVLWI